MKTFIIQENDKDQRLDKFLQKSIPRLPQSLLYKYLRKKRIKVNQKKCALNYRMQLNDRVDLYIGDEFFSTQPEYQFLSAPATIKVIYEDEHILLVNKPQGLVVHEDHENTMDTLIHRVQHYLYLKREYQPEDELSFAPALCNRIDRNTCGIVIIAKDAATLRILNEKIKNRELVKKYLCLVLGTPEPPNATLVHYLEKNHQENKVKIYQKPHENTKTIVTKYRVISSKNHLSLVEVDLKTGRTHQIRAHMAYIGHPLLGDGKYGNNAINKKYGYKQQALCSYYLKFEFQSDAGVLDYLNGKHFMLQDIWFTQQFYQNGCISKNILL